MAESGRLGQLQVEGRQFLRVVRGESAGALKVMNRCREREDAVCLVCRELVIAEATFRIAGLIKVICQGVGCRRGITGSAALEQGAHGAMQRSLFALQKLGENGLTGQRVTKAEL